MILHEGRGIPYYSFEALLHHDEIMHAVFTRHGGVSRSPFAELNVGHLVGDDPDAVEANHRLIYESLGLCAEQFVTATQVHSSRVAVVDASHIGKAVPATDALVTGIGGLNLMLRFADCLPILLYDPGSRATGLGHAGWRGTARGLARRMVSAMVEFLGVNPAETIACLGPAIGPCCYEVGPEVVRFFKGSLERWERSLLPRADDRFALDLWEANRQQLSEAGIRQIEASRMCTACNTDEFYSHRAERGATGRFAAVMGIRETK